MAGKGRDQRESKKNSGLHGDVMPSLLTNSVQISRKKRESWQHGRCDASKAYGETTTLMHRWSHSERKQLVTLSDFEIVNPI